MDPSSVISGDRVNPDVSEPYYTERELAAMLKVDAKPSDAR